MQNLPPIEGLVPEYVWIFLVVSVGLISLFVLIGKAVDVKDRFREKRNAREGRVETSPVADLRQKLLKFESDLTEIKAELTTINGKLDNDNRRIRALETEQKDIHDGFSVLATASLAMLEHEMHNGNSDQMESAKEKLVSYLTKR